MIKSVLTSFAFASGVANRIALSVAFAALVMFGSGVAHAGTIVGAVSVSASVSDLNLSFPIANLINQSGISMNYSSGVTDFDTFVGAATLTGNPSWTGGGGWASTTGNSFPATIDFDLGAAHNITRMALWNDTDVQALGNFELFASADALFTSLTSLGSFSGVVQNVGTLEQDFDMTDATTQYIRVKGSTVGSQNGLLNIGEFAFEAGSSVVPEPASLTLWTLGLVGMTFVRLRARQS